MLAETNVCRCTGKLGILACAWTKSLNFLIFFSKDWHGAVNLCLTGIYYLHAKFIFASLFLCRCEYKWVLTKFVSWNSSENWDKLIVNIPIELALWYSKLYPCLQHCAILECQFKCLLFHFQSTFLLQSLGRQCQLVQPLGLWYPCGRPAYFLASRFDLGLPWLLQSLGCEPVARCSLSLSLHLCLHSSHFSLPHKWCLSKK